MWKRENDVKWVFKEKTIVNSLTLSTLVAILDYDNFLTIEKFGLLLNTLQWYFETKSEMMWQNCCRNFSTSYVASTPSFSNFSTA